MIDFNKPLRVVDNPMSVIREPNDGTRLMSIDGRLCVIAWHGNVYRLEPMNVIVENVPSEPVKRYQAQYDAAWCGQWWSHEEMSTHTDSPRIVSWLVETDHGEDAPERYTYERLSVDAASK